MVPFQNFFVFLRSSFTSCNMKRDEDSSASGYINDSFEGISQVFTDVEILSTSDTNIVAKGKRYGKWWLLKGLRKEVAEETGYQQRLRKELEILMQLQHPSVVTAIGLEQIDDIGKCIVMEYVEGVTLKEWLQAEHSRKERRRTAMLLAEAVGYIHSKGIVHRDLKPENIIITTNGDQVKLIDFGLADTDSHAILKQPAGTPKYMSPEQMQTAMADVRNDIYSLGVVFSQMDLGYTYIINRCLLPIERRYQNVAELTDAIRKHDSLRSKMTWMASVVLILILAMVVYAQSVRVRDLTQQVTDNQQEQAQIQATISSLNDSLMRMTTAHQDLLQEQQQQDAQRRKVNDAITEGKALIYKQMMAKGVMQHLDTLTNLAYFNTDIFNRVINRDEVYLGYIEKIRGNFSESEIAVIINALISYDNSLLNKIMKRYNQLREAYDKANSPRD